MSLNMFLLGRIYLFFGCNLVSCVIFWEKKYDNIFINIFIILFLNIRLSCNNIITNIILIY